MSEPRPEAGLFVQTPGGPRGPLTADSLKQLAEGGAVTPETMAGDSNSGPWIPLGQHPMSAGLFPPRRAFELKEAEFERVNPLKGARTELRDLIRAANAKGPFQAQAAPTATPAAPNDVEALVRATAAANAAHEPPMTFEKRPNRRRRDFLILIGGGDGLGLLLLLVLPRNPFTSIGIISMMTIYTASVSWICWMLMDRY